MVHFTLTQQFSSLEKRSLVVFHFKLVIKGECWCQEHYTVSIVSDKHTLMCLLRGHRGLISNQF